MIGYIHQVCRDEHPGVARKISMQISAMHSAGLQIEELYLPVSKSIVHKTTRQLPLLPDGYNWHLIDCAKYSTLYIRRPAFISSDFVRFLCTYKSVHPHGIVLLELPTYPYDAEMMGLRTRLLLCQDRHNRQRLSGLVDRIVDLSGADTVFGIKTLETFNGVDLGAISVRKPSLDGNTTVNLACAAAFSSWHGIDRVIEGVKEYAQSGKSNIHIHLMGVGPESLTLKTLVSNYGLQDFFTFYGQCDKSQMDDVYDRCSLAIASLGMHRIGLQVASTLKTREYLAKGMPFVYAGEIDVFRKVPVDFCLQVPANNTPINFHDLIEFHKKIYRESEKCLINRIRNYAEKNVSIEQAMSPIINYIKENCYER